MRYFTAILTDWGNPVRLLRTGGGSMRKEALLWCGNCDSWDPAGFYHHHEGWPQTDGALNLEGNGRERFIQGDSTSDSEGTEQESVYMLPESNPLLTTQPSTVSFGLGWGGVVTKEADWQVTNEEPAWENRVHLSLCGWRAGVAAAWSSRLSRPNLSSYNIMHTRDWALWR